MASGEPDEEMQDEEMLAEARRRVTLGAEWLDKQVLLGMAPSDWRQRIEVARLDMQDMCRCVLGQLWSVDLSEIGQYPTTGYGRVRDHSVEGVPHLDEFETMAFGFDYDDGEDGPDFWALQQAWKEILDA